MLLVSFASAAFMSPRQLSSPSDPADRDLPLSPSPTECQHEEMDDYLWVLSRSEKDLIREIETDRLALLDEDELLSLHKRVRRARNKHATNYRRKAAARVEEAGARGEAHPRGAKSRLRAEAFEVALARVSRSLATRAQAEAKLLKTARLEAAKEGRGTGPANAPAADGKSVGAGRARSHAQTTGGVKRDASSAAQGARRQAKRDS